MNIACVTCGLVLREDAGVHQRGEPTAQRDNGGGFITCPACGHRLPYMDIVDGDEVGPSQAAP